MALFSNASLGIFASTVNNNIARKGGGIYTKLSLLQLLDSSIVSNTADEGRAGIGWKHTLEGILVAEGVVGEFSSALGVTPVALHCEIDLEECQ